MNSKKTEEDEIANDDNESDANTFTYEPFSIILVTCNRLNGAMKEKAMPSELMSGKRDG